jgi:hypothetical protein
LGSQTSGCAVGLAGWLLDFFWKNNSLRSDIFFRQKIQQPHRADGHWRVHGKTFWTYVVTPTDEHFWYRLLFACGAFLTGLHFGALWVSLVRG